MKLQYHPERIGSLDLRRRCALLGKLSLELREVLIWCRRHARDETVYLHPALSRALPDATQNTVQCHGLGCARYGYGHVGTNSTRNRHSCASASFRARTRETFRLSRHPRGAPKHKTTLDGNL